MNIANPIYDAVFKQLMSNMHIARFFISTIMEETVLDVAVSQQEMAYDKEGNPAGRSVPVAIFRLDFVATIKTANGEHKKVLIEIQKTRKFIDLMRFRNYLGEHYKRKDEVYTASGKLIETLPIVTIYLLGFELRNILSAAIKVNREYVDLVTHTIINAKDEFIEKLTHDCYVVQIPRIEGKLQSKLEKLLTIFEQKDFVDDTGDIKEYNYPIDDDDIKIIADTLHFACTDPESRRKIEAERESFRVFNVAVEQQTNRLNEIIEENKRALEESKLALEEKAKALEENRKALEDALKELAELKRRSQ